jgi:transketolase
METRKLPADWFEDIPHFAPVAKGMAGRDASGKVLNAIAKRIPWLVGGSADLAPSTKTRLTFENAGEFTATSAGRNFHFGVREHAMGAIVNGMANSGIRPYASGFFVFTDYMRASIRLSALMELPIIYIFTHDSLGVGEDGPTHQPVEHLASLRAMPGIVTIRPGDANEFAETWKMLIEYTHTPVVLVASRQAMPVFDRSRLGAASGVRQGAYILADAENNQPDVILVGSGTELQLCMDARERLEVLGIKARVVSMASWEIFEQQPVSYRNTVLLPQVRARVSVEMGATFGWERYTGINGARIGIDSFGASAPLKDLLRKFGFTVENVIQKAIEQIEIHHNQNSIV